MDLEALREHALSEARLEFFKPKEIDVQSAGL